MIRSRRIRALARGAYLALLAAAVVWLAVARGDEIAELLDGARIGLLAAALVATFGLIGLLARFWRISLRMLGHETPRRDLLLATARSLPARYIPGGLGFPAARIALLNARGLPLEALGATAALESVIRPAVALSFGAALLAVTGGLGAGVAWAAVALTVAAAAASPPVGGRLAARIAERRGVTLHFTWSGYARLAGAEVLYWLWASGCFVLYLQAFPAADDFGVARAAGAFMVAWAVGFLAVLAPQGIGVAELSLVALLATGDDATVALGFVFGGYRLVLAARDVTAALAAELLARRRLRLTDP